MTRVVVITGGAGGIGVALARVFGEDGARVVLVDLDAERLDAAASALRGEGIAADTFRLDITDPAACDAVFADIGDVDVLINNAGISHRSLFADTDPAVIRKVVDVNFFGAVNCTRAALPGLVRRRGAIVAMSSVAGFAPLIGRTAYAASKHALHGFFDTLRTELAPDLVRVLIVCPSFVATDLDRRHLGGDGATRGDRRQTVGAPLSPEAVAAAVRDSLTRGHRERWISPVARASWWLRHLAPAWYDRLMLRGQGAAFGR